MVPPADHCLSRGLIAAESHIADSVMDQASRSSVTSISNTAARSSAQPETERGSNGGMPSFVMRQ